MRIRFLRDYKFAHQGMFPELFIRGREHDADEDLLKTAIADGAAELVEAVPVAEDNGARPAGKAWRAGGQWAGDTCCILATGPSLTPDQAEYAKGKARVIAVNDAWRLAPWADILYACDAPLVAPS